MKKSKAAREMIQVQKKKPRVKRTYARDKIYTCLYCPKASVGKRDRRRHMFAVHKEELVRRLAGDKRRTRVEIERFQTADNKTAKCQFCGKEMNSKSLKKHEEYGCKEK